mmetsp:Transcript_34681/g.75803  ORF Transcript_34681/g.75803 Transcript_34681/m.75803 type:complete len:209 (+) Transcript_34681:327-953(+)
MTAAPPRLCLALLLDRRFILLMRLARLHRWETDLFLDRMPSFAINLSNSAVRDSTVASSFCSSDIIMPCFPVSASASIRVRSSDDRFMAVSLSPCTCLILIFTALSASAAAICFANAPFPEQGGGAVPAYFMSAYCLMMALMASLSATSRGLRCSLSPSSGSHPFFSMHSTTSRCPCQAAAKSGVQLLTPAPASNAPFRSSIWSGSPP